MTRRILAIAAILVSLLLCVTLDVAAQADGRATYHVFPQLAFGTLPDGSSYQATLLIDNTSATSEATCTFPTSGGTASSATIAPTSFTLYSFTSSAALVSGYLGVSCNTQVFATLLYSYNSSAGKTIAEATVFSS